MSNILRQWNRNCAKRLSKPVEYELFDQNYMARQFTSIVRDMAQKQTDIIHGYDTKNR